jgi:hypothetical protein
LQLPPAGGGLIQGLGTMKYHIASRIIAAAILAIALAQLMHHVDRSKKADGKEAYLAQQGKFFDRSYANPSGPSYGASIFMLTVVVGSYELLAFGIFVVIKPRHPARGA